MGIFRGDIFSVDWTDIDAVVAVAKQLASGNSPAQIVFWNGNNYQITFAERRSSIEEEGYSVVYTTEGQDDR